MKKIIKKSDVHVYIAGKYTDKTMVQIEQNILNAKKIAVECAYRRIKFFCPHTHTAHFGEYSQNSSWQYYMNLCIPILRNVCNVIIMVPNWEDSEGAKYELNIARDLGYMSFLTVDQFFIWYENTLQD
jgi:hypothetical protein